MYLYVHHSKKVFINSRNYEYEIEQNEKKRIIKLLKPEFITEVEEEFKRNFA